MKARFLVLAIVLGLMCLPVLAGGIVFLSGDAGFVLSPINPVDPRLDAGNQQFLQNVLQGGTEVVIRSDFFDVPRTFVNNFYNSLSGVNSTILGEPITTASLTGADLLFNIQPTVAYTSGEISAMANFLNGNGTIFFIGENTTAVISNTFINDVLLALGSSMSIIPNSVFDIGSNPPTTGTGSQIAADPFTAGVNTFSYSAPSGIVFGEGTPLFKGTDGNPFFIAYESVNPVPEPATLSLLAAGLLAGAVFRKRFK